MSEPTVVEPALIVNPPPQPLFSLRRIVILALLVAGTVFLVYAFDGAPDAGGGSACANPAIAGWNPCPGSRVLRQAQIGVTLRTGYDGRITINGVAIPEDQMVGAILPGSAAYDQLSPEERKLGPRPNNKTLVAFEPGKGKIIKEFNGQLDVSVSFWRVEEGPTESQTVTYTVFVT